MEENNKKPVANSTTPQRPPVSNVAPQPQNRTVSQGASNAQRVVNSQQAQSRPVSPKPPVTQQQRPTANPQQKPNANLQQRTPVSTQARPISSRPATTSQSSESPKPVIENKPVDSGSQTVKKATGEPQKNNSKAFYIVFLLLLCALISFAVFYFTIRSGQNGPKIVDADFDASFNYYSASVEIGAFYQKENDADFTNLTSGNASLISIQSNEGNGQVILSSNGNIVLDDTNKYVIFGYSFKNNSPVYDIKVSLDNYINSESVYIGFLVSDTKYISSNISSQRTLINGVNIGSVNVSAGCTKYFYVLVEKLESAEPLNYAMPNDKSIEWNIESTMLVDGETPLEFFNIKGNQIYSVAVDKVLDEDIVIPSSVTGIMNGAFENNHNIRSVVIHNGVQGIGWNAFAGSTLTSAIFSNTDNWYVTGSQVNQSVSTSIFSPNVAARLLTNQYNELSLSSGFANCYWTKTSVMPTSYDVLQISQNKIPDFEEGNTGIVNVSNVVIPYGVTQIGKYAFAGVSSSPNNTLSNISIPNSIEAISDFAFYECSTLSTNTYLSIKYLGNAQNPYLVLFNAQTSATSLTIPSGTKVIYEDAFKNNSTIINLIFSENVISISRNAFQSMTALVSVTFVDGLEVIGDYAFNSCSSLKSLELPSTLLKIGTLAFGGCSELNYIKLNAITPPTKGTDNTFGTNEYTPILVPNDSLTIYKTTYSTYSTRIYSQNNVSSDGLLCVTEGLTKKLVKYIGENSNVVVTSDITVIGNYAFYHNTFVQTIYIASPLLSSIGDYAFVGCDFLTTITLTATTPPSLGENVFLGLTSGDLKIYVPQSAIDTYISHPSYSSLSSIIQAG